MTIAEQIRRSYEDRPYPAAGRGVVSGRFKHLPSLAWMQAIGRPGEPAPRRVLVAGCGTGAEAFEVRQTLPGAEVVAVDFSPRSIAIARRLQRAARLDRPIRFVVADLSDSRLVEETGGGFDLITCHGVLSYLPTPERILRNLAGCVRAGGALYLGVNGDAHPAVRLRHWLTQFGLRVEVLRDERRLRELLRLWDALHCGPTPALAGLPASYLAGDVCGTHFNNWSLARWCGLARRCGWHIAGSWLLPQLLRRTLEDSRHRPMFPSRLAELLGHADVACPASFHRFLFRRGPTRDLEWDGAVAPRHGQLRWTGLYSLNLARPRRGQTVQAILRCPIFNLQLDWPLSRAEAEVFELLSRTRAPWIPWPPGFGRSEAARRMLWLWMGFGVIGIRQAGFTSPRSPRRASPI